MSRFAIFFALAAGLAGTGYFAFATQVPKAASPPSGVQMTASGKFVYLLRGDEILQFEATTLEFIKKVKVPAGS